MTCKYCSRWPFMRLIFKRFSSNRVFFFRKYFDPGERSTRNQNSEECDKIYDDSLTGEEHHEIIVNATWIELLCSSLSHNLCRSTILYCTNNFWLGLGVLILFQDKSKQKEIYAPCRVIVVALMMHSSPSHVESKRKTATKMHYTILIGIIPVEFKREFGLKLSTNEKKIRLKRLQF